MAKRTRVPGTRGPVRAGYNRAFVRIEMLTSSAGIFHPIGARLSPDSYGNHTVAFPIHFVTSFEREAEIVAALERNQAPPERPTTMPADFVRLETEEERRQAEPTIAISGFGWQHYVENPHKIAELWGVAAYFGAPEPDVDLLTWDPDRFSVVYSESEFAAGNSP
jgi:hypothetical protein